MVAEGEILPDNFTVGSGCYQCSDTGYKGRVGIYEWLEMDDRTLGALRRADPDAFAEAAKMNAYYEPLDRCALEYARQGITTIDEVFRISATLDELGASLDDELEIDLDELDE
ncbi:hypothetical protein A3735_22815 [Oleiphilus sp. HI0061]|nr:hypothetical protein A3735_22815 [Oleiphilus sp. HI0061]